MAPWTKRSAFGGRGGLLVLGAVLITGTGLAVLDEATRPHAASRREHARRESGPAAADVPLASAAATARFVQGTVRAWDVSIRTDARLEPEGKPAQALFFTATGTLVQVVSQAGSDGATLTLRLDGPHVQAGDDRGGAAEPASTRGVEAALAIPFSVSVDPAGRALSLRFAKETDVLARGLLRGLVAASQLVVPPGAGGEWLTSEQDAVGEVFAAYRQTGAREITRSRVRYERIASSGGLVPVAQVGNVTGTSVTRFVFEGDAAPIRIASDATTRTEPEPGVRGLPPSEGRVRTTWTRVAEGAEAPSREPRADDVVLALAAVDGGGRRSDAERAEGTTFPELAKSLATLPPGGARAAEAAKLRALLRADDGAVDQAKRAVLAPGTKDGKKQLVSALGAAGTRHAQAALVDLSETRALGEDPRTDALMQLGTTREPTLDAVASLEKLSRDPDAAIRHTAELALGNQARSMQAAGRVGEADEVVKHLLDQYAAASGDDERATVLRALGNTGSPALLPLARAAAMSGSAALRTAAAVALRFVDAPGAVPLLAHLMTADGDPDVRGGAIFAAGHRDVAPLLPALARVLAYDEHGRNRRAVVDVLAEKRALEPALAMLRSVAETDPDPELREAARRLLAVRAG